MIKKIVRVIFVIIVVLAGVGFYCTPYVTYRNMRIAAENKDTETLNSYVDFNSLKESLKANLHDKIAGESGGTNEEDTLEKMGAAFAAAFINPLIDAFITPEGLAMIVRGYIPERRKLHRSEEKKTADHTDRKSSKKDSTTDVSTYYENFNSFVVAFKDKNSEKDRARLIFNRTGIVSWKLCAMKLP